MNDVFAGRKYFDMGVFYDNMQSKSDAMAAVTGCAIPEHDGPWSPPYARLSGEKERTDSSQGDKDFCKRVLLWPRVVKSSGVYTEGLNDYHVYSSKERIDDGSDFDGPLPGDLMVSLAPPDITLVPLSGDMTIKIRETSSGALDSYMRCIVHKDTTHWLLDQSEWDSILSTIISNDYARDGVPHAMGLYFASRRWRYQCFVRTDDEPQHYLVYPDNEPFSKLTGGCFFLEPLTALYS